MDRRPSRISWRNSAPGHGRLPARRPPPATSCSCRSRCLRIRRCLLPFAGKTVLDTGNYYPQRDGRIEALDSGPLTDSEYLAWHLPGARVVKVFNNIFHKHLQNLARPASTKRRTRDRTYLPIAGDSAEAKFPSSILDSIGYGADDAGPLADSWRQQPGTPVYGAPYGEFENEKGTPANAAIIRAALAAATRM